MKKQGKKQGNPRSEPGRAARLLLVVQLASDAKTGRASTALHGFAAAG
jgi:hypothetical protein